MDLDEHGFLGVVADHFESELRSRYASDLSRIRDRHLRVQQRLTASGVNEFDTRGLIVVSAVARSLAHSEASLMMAFRGHPVAAEALARCALESIFIGAAVARSRRNLQRFRVKYFDERVRTLEWLERENVCDLPSGESVTAELKKARLRASRFTSFGKPKKRSGLHVKDFADAAGMQRAYKLQYAALSFAVHPDPTSLVQEHIASESGKIIGLRYEAKDRVPQMMAHIESMLAINEKILTQYFS